MDKKLTYCLTGTTGLVGGYIIRRLRNHLALAPGRGELDITDAKQVQSYITLHRPDCIIHAAAFTDNDAAERQRGDTSGTCWRVNVEGTRNIAAAAKKVGAYLIFLSTGSVFAGNKKYVGPFSESDTPAGEEKLSWYAWTKRVAERALANGAIIRLSHPVGEELAFEQTPARRDYVHTLVHLFDTNTLYPLFPDQFFTLTFMDDVVLAIKELMVKQYTGIFHIASFDQTNPYDLASYAIYRARHVKPQLKTIPFEKFIQTVPHHSRYTQYLGIDGRQTQKKLRVPTRTWKEIIDCVYPLPAVY